MSIVALCNRDTCHLRRETSTPDAEGQAIKTWTAAARGALPADGSKFRHQGLSHEEAVAYGVVGKRLMWSAFFSYDPKIDSRDHVFFTDDGGTARECRVIKPPQSFDSQNRLLMAILEEFGPEK